MEAEPSRGVSCGGAAFRVGAPEARGIELEAPKVAAAG